MEERSYLPAATSGWPLMADVDRRYGGEERRALLVDDLEHGIQLEARQQDHLGAELDAEIHHHGHGEDVEKRQHADHDLAACLGIGHHHRRLRHVRREVGVGQHRALRDSGGAAGVLKHRDIVVDLDLDRRGPAGVVGQLAEEHMAGIARYLGDLAALDQGEEQPLEAGQHVRHGADHQMGEPRLFKRDAGLVVEDGEVEGDQDVGLRILDLALDLLDGVERVDVDDRPAGLQHSVIYGDEVRAMGKRMPTLVPLRTPSFWSLRPRGSPGRRVPDRS